jgi:hypothetical protein
MKKYLVIFESLLLLRNNCFASCIASPKYESGRIHTSHIPLPHKRVISRLFQFDFELDANEAEAKGDNADADEAIEA